MIVETFAKCFFNQIKNVDNVKIAYWMTVENSAAQLEKQISNKLFMKFGKQEKVTHTNKQTTKIIRSCYLSVCTCATSSKNSVVDIKQVLLLFYNNKIWAMALDRGSLLLRKQLAGNEQTVFLDSTNDTLTITTFMPSRILPGHA